MSTAQKALKGTFFVAAGNYASIFVSFVSGVVLARLLEPADFGLYRLALFFADLFGRVREFGLDKALIHKQDNLPQAYRVHFTLSLILSILALFLSIAFAPLVSQLYSRPISFYLILISLFGIFQAAGSTQRVILEKNLQFGRTALVDISALILSASLTVFLAYRGWGPLSLVLGYGFNLLFVFIFLWISRPWRVSFGRLLLLDPAEFKWFFRFGVYLFLGGLTTFILYKYNDYILGTYLSVAALGFYSRAFNYAQIPTSLITSVVSRVALPTYSALQGDKEKLAGTFSIVLKSIIRVSFPLSLILYMTADDFTVFVLGPKWIPMIPIFRILIVYGVFRSIFDDLGEFFTAVGQPKLVSFYLTGQALLSLVLAPVLTRLYQAEGAAISLSIVLGIGVMTAYVLIKRVVRIRTLSLFLPTILVCFLTMIAFKFVVYRFNLNFTDPFYSLLSKALVFSFFYLVFMSLIDGRSFLKDLKFMWDHFRLKE